MFENLDFGGGEVIYNDYNSGMNQLSDELYNLDEDMLQIVYEKDYLLDVGWYVNSFIVYIIKNKDWENPIQRLACKNFNNLDYYVQISIDTIKKLLCEPSADKKFPIEELLYENLVNSVEFWRFEDENCLITKNELGIIKSLKPESARSLWHIGLTMMSKIFGT